MKKITTAIIKFMFFYIIAIISANFLMKANFNVSNVVNKMNILLIVILSFIYILIEKINWRIGNIRMQKYNITIRDKVEKIREPFNTESAIIQGTIAGLITFICMS